MGVAVIGRTRTVALGVVVLWAFANTIIDIAAAGEEEPRVRTISEMKADLRAMVNIEDDMEFMSKYRSLVREEFRVADWVALGGQVPLNAESKIALANQVHGPQLLRGGAKPVEFAQGGFCQLLTKDGLVDLGSERVAEAMGGFLIVGAKDHVFVIRPESSDVYVVARKYAERPFKAGGK